MFDLEVYPRDVGPKFWYVGLEEEEDEEEEEEDSDTEVEQEEDEEQTSGGVWSVEEELEPEPEEDLFFFFQVPREIEVTEEGQELQEIEVDEPDSQGIIDIVNSDLFTRICAIFSLFISEK